MTDVSQKIGIVGAGTMGVGIMINCITNQFDVVLTDRNSETLDTAKNKLLSYLKRQVTKERLSQSKAAQLEKRLTISTKNEALAECHIVIEAVFENLDLKKTVFAELEAIVSPQTILASNTSCLRLADIAEGLKDTARFCGLHYFSPAEINPVVELIAGPSSTEKTLKTAADFLKATRKEVIDCKDRNGFALNRFFCPYFNEAVRLFDEGIATPAQIDAVAVSKFGVALGPFAVMNIIGTATSFNAQSNLAPLGPFYTPAQGLVEMGQNGASWDIAADVEPLTDDMSKTIFDRLTAAILVPVHEILAEETATLDALNRGAALAFRFTWTPGDMIQDLGAKQCQKLIQEVNGAPSSN